MPSSTIRLRTKTAIQNIPLATHSSSCCYGDSPVVTCHVTHILLQLFFIARIFVAFRDRTSHDLSINSKMAETTFFSRNTRL